MIQYKKINKGINEQMSKIKKFTKKLRKKLDKKNIDVKETDIMELKKLRNKAKGMTDSRIKKKMYI